MFRIGYQRDRVNNQLIPTGRRIANLFATYTQPGSQFANYVMRETLRGNRPNIAHYIAAIAEPAAHLLAVYVREGQRQRARQMLAQIERRRRNRRGPRATKSLHGPWAGGATGFADLSWGFDIHNPNVAEFIRNSAYQFAKSTLETSAIEAAKVAAFVRSELSAGLSAGETTREINRRMVAIFHDPERAARIGQTESMRAMSGGAYMLGQETGVSNKTRWLASPDACPICLGLNGQERAYGEPFLIHKKPGPYQVVLHPPAHVGCFCSFTEVYDPAAVNDQSVAALRILAYNPSQATVPFRSGAKMAASLWARQKSF